MLKPSLRPRISNANLEYNSSTPSKRPFDTVSTTVALASNTTFKAPSSSVTTPTLASPNSIKSTHTDTSIHLMDGNHTSPDVIGIHRGAIDNTTITTRPPKEVMVKVQNVLDSIGVCIQPESTFKFRCIRPSQSSSGSEASVEDSAITTSNVPTNTIYSSDSSTDPGGEVRFSVELTRLAGLSDTYTLDIRRLKGNLRSYKFLYETIRDRAQLSF